MLEDWITNNTTAESQNDLGKLSETLNKLRYIDQTEWGEEFAYYADNISFYKYFICVMKKFGDDLCFFYFYKHK